MRKSRPYKKKKKELFTHYRKNERIRVPEVRLIDETGEMVGIISTREALNMAREREVDLIEVSPKTRPPVAKLLDYGKLRYQQEKIAQQQKTKQKQSEIKGVRISFRISDHDKETRMKQTKKFLEQGNKVKIELILKGRERRYTNNAKEILHNFVKELGENTKIEQAITVQGGKLSILIKPN